MPTFDVEPIGVIHSPFAAKEECPIQSGLSDAPGRVEVFPRYGEGLETIESFTHIYLLYVFDRAGETVLSRPTFLDDERHGVFASRHPCRPNGIGMSIVRLEGRTGNVLRVRGLDVLDGTPLLDIKPYIPRFDYCEDAGNGWVEGLDDRPKPDNRE